MSFHEKKDNENKDSYVYTSLIVSCAGKSKSNEICFFWNFAFDIAVCFIKRDKEIGLGMFPGFMLRENIISASPQ
jgi:hypothetical protein